jgi:hypothetical protein
LSREHEDGKGEDLFVSDQPEIFTGAFVLNFETPGRRTAGEEIREMHTPLLAL